MDGPFLAGKNALHLSDEYAKMTKTSAVKTLKRERSGLAKKRVDFVNIHKSTAAVSMVVLALVLAVSLAAVVGMNWKELVLHADTAVSPSDPVSLSDVSGEPEPEPLHVTSRATISVTGDVIGHMPMLTAAYNAKTKTYNFDNIFTYIQRYASDSDYAIANLETTLRGTEGGDKYRGYPCFNTPDAMADALKKAQFDMLLTANNHTYDSGLKGVTRTLEVLNDRGFDHIGTVLKASDKHYLVKEVNGIKIGMTCYTYETSTASSTKKSLNGIPLSAEAGKLVDSFRYGKLDAFYGELEERLAAMKNEGAEVTVLFIHWGTEYQVVQNKYQKQMAQKICDLGVDVIVGGHPHVIQPVSLLTSKKDSSHKTLCLYSMGNAVSNQRKERATLKTGHTEDGCLFSVTFQKYSDGRVIVADTELLPTWVNLYTNNKTGKKVYQIIPLDKSVTDWKKAFGLSASAAYQAEKSYNRTVKITGEGMAQAQEYYRAAAKAILSDSDLSIGQAA